MKTRTRTEVVRQIREIGIIPVVRASNADEAMRAVDAIREGGIPIIEITLTVPGAIDVIEKVATRFGNDTLVGAGTVLEPEIARACISSGAKFIVSPALIPETIACCRELDVVVLPGALTPTEVVTAWNAGADFVKVFPAGAVGGPAYLKALKAPLPQIELIPTGGVSLTTGADFIKAGAAALGVGGDLVAGEARLITERAKQFLEIVREARTSTDYAD